MVLSPTSPPTPPNPLLFCSQSILKNGKPGALGSFPRKNKIKNENLKWQIQAKPWWLTPIILAIWEAQMGGITIPDHPGHLETPSQWKKLGAVARVLIPASVGNINGIITVLGKN
jgi:hypothetical protein